MIKVFKAVYTHIYVTNDDAHKYTSAYKRDSSDGISRRVSASFSTTATKEKQISGTIHTPTAFVLAAAGGFSSCW